MGAGRKLAEELTPGLVDALDDVVEPGSRGDPMCALRWTTKSTRNLASELTERGFAITHSVVVTSLTVMGYSLRLANPPRAAIIRIGMPGSGCTVPIPNCLVEQFRAVGKPVISVDAKKKELISNFATAAQQWRPDGQPVETNTHDFPDPELGKAVPYDVYDVARDAGGFLWVTVSIRHSFDTAEFAVATIRRWWTEVAQRCIPKRADCYHRGLGRIEPLPPPAMEIASSRRSRKTPGSTSSCATSRLGTSKYQPIGLIRAPGVRYVSIGTLGGRQVGGRRGDGLARWAGCCGGLLAW